MLIKPDPTLGELLQMSPRQIVKRAMHNARVGMALCRNMSPDDLSATEIVVLETLSLESLRLGELRENARWNVENRDSKRPTKPPTRRR